MTEVLGVVLAGGLSSRMGGQDKRFLKLGDQSLLEIAVEKALPQVCQLIISCSNSTPQLSTHNLPLVSDVVKKAGPLSGLLSSMQWATLHSPESTYLASFPADSPFFPRDLVNQLKHALQSSDAKIAIPRYGGQTHWVFCLWSLSLRQDLQHYLVNLKKRKTQDWIRRHEHIIVDFDELEFDPFFNINTPEDLKLAKSYFLDKQTE